MKLAWNAFNSERIHKCSRSKHPVTKSRFVIAQENTRPCKEPQKKSLFHQRLNSMRHRWEQDNFRRRWNSMTLTWYLVVGFVVGMKTLETGDATCQECRFVSGPKVLRDIVRFLASATAAPKAGVCWFVDSGSESDLVSKGMLRDVNTELQSRWVSDFADHCKRFHWGKRSRRCEIVSAAGSCTALLCVRSDSSCLISRYYIPGRNYRRYSTIFSNRSRPKVSCSQVRFK